MKLRQEGGRKEGRKERRKRNKSTV